MAVTALVANAVPPLFNLIVIIDVPPLWLANTKKVFTITRYLPGELTVKDPSVAVTVIPPDTVVYVDELPVRFESNGLKKTRPDVPLPVASGSSLSASAVA